MTETVVKLSEAHPRVHGAAIESPGRVGFVYHKKTRQWLLTDRYQYEKASTYIQQGIFFGGSVLITAFSLLLPSSTQPKVSFASFWHLLIGLCFAGIGVYFRFRTKPVNAAIIFNNSGECRIPSLGHTSWHNLPIRITFETTSELHPHDHFAAILHAGSFETLALFRPCREGHFIVREIESWPEFLRERCVCPLPTR